MKGLIIGSSQNGRSRSWEKFSQLPAARLDGRWENVCWNKDKSIILIMKIWGKESISIEPTLSVDVKL